MYMNGIPPSPPQSPQNEHMAKPIFVLGPFCFLRSVAVYPRRPTRFREPSDPVFLPRFTAPECSYCPRKEIGSLWRFSKKCKIYVKNGVDIIKKS